MQGKMVIFSAPSGAGKTTLVRHLLDNISGLAFSVSATSREKRPYEIDGKDYYFISVNSFREKIKSDDFVEWEEVYSDHFYGTLRSEINRLWSKGLNIIFDVDVVGGLNIKNQFGPKALAVFVMPPSPEELERRLIGRSTENEKSLNLRIAKAADEMKFARDFDTVIVNDVLDEAKKEALAVVNKFLKT